MFFQSHRRFPPSFGPLLKIHNRGVNVHAYQRKEHPRCFHKLRYMCRQLKISGIRAALIDVEGNQTSYMQRQNSSDLRSKSAINRYGIAILLSIVTLALTFWVRSFADSEIFDLFYGAVFLSALYGGLGPALLTSFLSIIACDFFFIPPLYAISYSNTCIVLLVVFAIVSLLTSSLSARLKKAKSDLECAYSDLEDRIQHRTRELAAANKTLMQEVAQRTEAEKAILEISDRERRGLGQDLHDGLCQIITGIKFMAQGIREELIERSVPAVEKMLVVESELKVALAYVDSVARGLYPVELEVHGFVPALEELIEKIPKVYPVTCRFTCRTPVSINNDIVALHIYRIAQEAIINAIKGGKAKRIHMRLYRQEENMMLTVVDNGLGLGNVPMRKGMGMKMMEYRARAIDASLKFQSRVKGGTMVVCSFSEGDENGI